MNTETIQIGGVNVENDIAYVFGVFGLMAYLQMSSLKKRISALEEQMSGLQGTSYAENKKSLKKIATELIGKNVIIELKEEQQDYDITMYGNTKYGSNTIKNRYIPLDAPAKKHKGKATIPSNPIRAFLRKRINSRIINNIVKIRRL